MSGFTCRPRSPATYPGGTWEHSTGTLRDVSPGMRHAALALLLAAAALAPATARAEGVSFVANFNMSTAGTTGAIGSEMDAMNFPILWLAAGFRTRHIGVMLDGDFMGFAPNDESLDGRELLSFGGGVEIVGYQQIGGGWELYGRGGRRWRWLGGGEEVIRTCHQTGTCAGGFWPEEPSYRSSGLAFAVGLQRTFADRSVAGAVGLELRVEQVAMPLPGRGTVDGAIVLFGLNAALGSTGHRR